MGLINFLRNLASQLGELLGFTSAEGNDVENNSPDDYEAFLQLLLQTEYENFGGGLQHIYAVHAVLQSNLDKLNLNFIPILQQTMTKIMSGINDSEQVKGYAALIENIAIKISQFPKGNRADNLEIAIAAYEILLSVRTFETNPEDWAMTQNNLAVAYSDRIKGERSDNIEQAIRFYSAALQVYTRDAFPQEWAMAQNNLGEACRKRIRGERADNIEQAIKYYNTALEVYKRETFPEYWGQTQNNLAIAYYSRIRGERADNIEQAIKYYNAALEVYKRETFPEEWATMQNNLGVAYSDRIRGERADNIEQAIACYSAALQVRTRKAFPEKWAETQNNLAIAYYSRVRGERPDNLEEAIACYSAALQVRTRKAFPEKWAETQNNLAIAYCDRIRGERADNIEQAIGSCTAALEVYTRKAFPEYWAMTQHNLAIAYLYRIREEQADNLEQAIACYTAALEVRTNDAFPEKWAETQHNLANVYLYRIRGERADNIKQAIRCCEDALKVRTHEAFPQNHAETLLSLGLAYREVPNLQLAYDTFSDAINTVELLRGEIHSGDETKQKLAEEWNKLYVEIVEVCLELKNYTAAIEYAERSKARNLVELLANREIKPKGDVADNVLKELARLRQEIYIEQRRLEIEEINRNILGGIMSETRGIQTTIFMGNRTHMNQLQKQLDELINHAIKPIDPNFSLTQKVEPIPYKEIHSLTGENTTILEWYITGDKFLTFIITPQSPTPIIWQSSTADLKKLVRWANGYLRSYRKKKKDLWKRQLTVRLRLLAKILHLDEILKNIPKQCDQLILIPHRYLHLFPLHALPVSQETWLQFNPNSDSSPANPYLLDYFVGGVGYAPSCQLLQQAQMRQRPNFSHLFAIANPTSDRYLLELQAANIRYQFQSNDFLAKDDANKNAILNGKLSLANCAHFGCHGKFEPDSPLESALKLANNERLTLLEILNLDLNQCRLVTLSACETGLTESSTSDEYIGLPFGFLLAGSPSMVSTLWEVDQLASTLLLIRFYENLETLSTVTALNEAQQWLRNLTSEELEAELERLKPQIDQTFEQLPLKERTRYVNAPLNGARNRKPFPFTEPHYWAGFTAIGV